MCYQAIITENFVLGSVFCTVNDRKRNINRASNNFLLQLVFHRKYVTENELKMPREILRPGNKTAKQSGGS